MYYVFVMEKGLPIQVGQSWGYLTIEAARLAAEKAVDDALPNNRVHILKSVGYAYLAGDGDVGYHEGQP